MPDAAKRSDMQRGDADLLLRLRLFILRAPLLLPLVGVVAALLGGAWWSVAVVAGAIAAVMRLWRILACMLLCAFIAAFHEGMRQRDAARAQEVLSQRDAVELEGNVIDMLGRGCVLRVESWGVTVALRGESLPYAEGDYVRVVAQPREVEPPPIRGMFDRSSWLRSRGMAAELDFIRGERLGAPFSWALVRGFATNVRHALADRLMPPGTEGDPRRQILCALVLGARELAEPGTMLPFRRGGTLHAFAVSGMHVGLVAGFLWVLLRLLRVQPSTGRWLLLLVLGFYIVVTGFSVPAVRAYVMLATLLIGVALRRRVGLVNSWCFAALLVLLVEPWQLYSAGFLLSFAIYAAICIGAGFCLRERSWFGPDEFIPPRIYTAWEQHRRQADGIVRGVIMVALVAYVVSLPLSWVLFHTVSPWGFISNIVIAPLVPLVMLAGIALLVVAGIPMLGAAVAWCALRSAGALLAVSTWLGYLPGAYLAAERPQAPQAAMVWGTGYGGSCCVLGNPGLVIDCGSEVSAALQVEPALFHAGYRPATLLLSQPAEKQRSGADVLLATWPQLQVICAEELGEHPVVLEGCAGRMTLYPPPPELPRRPASNAAPIVRWERPDGSSLLYVGDASRATWERLPQEARRADILILGMNPRQPVDDPAVVRATGARLVVLLPAASGSQLQEQHAAPGARLLRLGEYRYLPLP